MNVIDVELLVKNLGQTYTALNSLGILNGQPISAIFPEDDRRYIHLETGVQLDLDAESLRAEVLLFTVFEVIDFKPFYKGDLWPGLNTTMDQEAVRAVLGPPTLSGPPGENRCGEHGGWDEFKVLPELDNIFLTVNYLRSTQVRAFAFELNLP